VQRYGMTTYGAYVARFLGSVQQRLGERLVFFAVFGSVARDQAVDGAPFVLAFGRRLAARLK